jgi:hypothetical protein
MSLFLLTCPALVDTFRIGTHTPFLLSIYIVHFFNVFHLTVARPLPPLIGLETSFYRVFLAIASGLSIYTHSVPVLTYLASRLSIYTYSTLVLTLLRSGLSIYTHSVPVLTYLTSGLSIYTHSTTVLAPFCFLLALGSKTHFTHSFLLIFFSFFYIGANSYFTPAFLFTFLALPSHGANFNFAPALLLVPSGLGIYTHSLPVLPYRYTVD